MDAALVQFLEEVMAKCGLQQGFPTGQGRSPVGILIEREIFQDCGGSLVHGNASSIEDKRVMKAFINAGTAMNACLTTQFVDPFRRENMRFPGANRRAIATIGALVT